MQNPHPIQQASHRKFSGRKYPNARAVVIENDRATTSAKADAFQAGVSAARVVRISSADHFVFRSNEMEVIRKMAALDIS